MPRNFLRALRWLRWQWAHRKCDHDGPTLAELDGEKVNHEEIEVTDGMTGAKFTVEGPDAGLYLVRVETEWPDLDEPHIWMRPLPASSRDNAIAFAMEQVSRSLDDLEKELGRKPTKLNIDAKQIVSFAGR